jgi:uncharacterized protein (TIGR00299 family) protein
MTTLYLDIFSGISGDMFLGAMIDLGVDIRQIEHELAKLQLGGYHLHSARKLRQNIAGVKFDVHLEHEHTHEIPGADDPTSAQSHSHHHGDQHPSAAERHHRHSHEHEQHHHHEHDEEHNGHHIPAHEHGRTFADIKKLIGNSTLSDWVKQKATAVFYRVAVAEGKIHGLPPDQVHFHEVGAVDSIVDIVGACIALERLDKPRVLAAPVVEGTGWVDCAHGRFPVPTAATLEILGARGVAVTQCDEPHELVTPTGAALLAEFAERFGPMQGLVAGKIGYGLGARDNQTRPNVLRVILGEAPAASRGAAIDWETDTVAAVETNLDDLSAEILGYFVERAFAEGALEVFYTPIQMKKNRPGSLLTVLCRPGDTEAFCELMLRETSAFGVRHYTVERRKLKREIVSVPTAYGDVAVKIGRLNGAIVQVSPEYESCKKLAALAGVPLKQVYAAAATTVKV